MRQDGTLFTAQDACQHFIKRLLLFTPRVYFDQLRFPTIHSDKSPLDQRGSVRGSAAAALLRDRLWSSS